MQTIKNKKLIGLLASLLAILLIMPVTGTPRAVASGTDHHIKVALSSVGGSGISGFVNLVQRPDEGGTQIHVVANGLQPGAHYVSLYYDNNTCTLPGDLLNTYTGNAAGIGTTNGIADDDLDEVDSVSVRDATTLELFACAVIHP
ncbi:MAG: hypothetical protein ACJ78Q_14015 [Chloroflexia bacterium]